MVFESKGPGSNWSVMSVILVAMPRRPRLHLSGLPLHIVPRGHNRDACFFTTEDYFAYREWLGEPITATGCQLHAYVQ